MYFYVYGCVYIYIETMCTLCVYIYIEMNTCTQSAAARASAPPT